MSTHTQPAELRRNRPFTLFWASETVSEVGNAITLVALPLIAVNLLAASEFQVGLLVATENLAWLLLGLPAGAWVDRWDARRVMVISDWARAVLIASIPVTALFGVLGMPQLYLVSLAVGGFTVFFSIAYQAVLPSIVRTSDLVTANGRMQLTQSTTSVLGPGLGGALIQLLSAAGAMVVDVMSFVVSALLLGRVRPARPSEQQASRRRSLRSEITTGLSYVFSDRRLRALTLCGAHFNFMVAAQQAVVVVFLVRVVELPDAMVGLLLGSVGLGGALAAIFSGRFLNRDAGARMTISMTVGTLAGLLVPMTFPGWGLLLFVIGYAALSAAVIVFNIVSGSFRQAICPPELRGRMAASTRMVTWGALPLGALVGGAVAQRPGFRIDVLYWVQNATTTHKHISCGAFAAVGGTRVHNVYDFTPDHPIGDHVWSGRLRRTATDVMRSSQAHPILPGLIHDIYWVNTPSVTLVVRCDDHPGRDQLQPLEYWLPGMAFLDRLHQKDSTISKKVEALRLMAGTTRNRYRTTLTEVLNNGPSLLAYHAFRDSLILRPDHSVDELLAGANRADGLLKVLREAAVHIRRKAILESVYCGSDTEAQTLAAVLWTGVDGTELVDLLAEALPGTAPGEAVDRIGDRLIAVSAATEPLVAAARHRIRELT